MNPTSLNPDLAAEVEKSFPIVGIGASAGGIEACSTLLRELPEDSGIAYVVIQHLGANSPSMLSRILARETAIPVVEAEHEMAVEPDRAYVIPPNMRMTIAQGRLQLSPREKSDRPFMSIDIFFKSLAEDCHNRAIGVVLSGLDGDGAEGLKHIKRAGGITFAQSQSTAEYSDMPNSAAETGQVDFILPPAEIARQLLEIAHHPYVTELDSFQIQTSEAASKAASESDLLSLYALLKTATGIDFNQYKRATFERRLKRRLALYRFTNLEAYLEHLRSNPTEINALYRDVLITVTSFFRDAETFEFLKTTIYPLLIEQKELDASIRIWVAGCATGEECYSIAISLFEFLSERNVNLSIQIFGTDVNEEAIDVARRGVYPTSKMDGVSAERRQRFFTYTEGHYQVSKAVRELCVFARQNLGGDPPFSNVDLVSCRNVMIYFTPALQKRVRAIFHYSLRPGGFLLLGSSESVGETSELFSAVDTKHRVYAQSTAVNRLSFDFVTSDHTALNPQGLAEGAPTQNPNYSNVQRQADQIVLNRYAPVGVVVNDLLDILHFRGDTSPYLTPAAGEPSFNLLKMVRPSLIVELRSVIEKAKVQNVIARKEGLQIENNLRYIQVEVTPIKNPLSRERNYLVLFEEGSLIEQEPASSTSQNGEEEAVKQVNPVVARLEQELAAVKQELLDTQAYLQATIEENDATNQRLTTANEEILSSNEELQSTNEELQTAKEEIQAANEELKTTNEELQDRNDDARASNDDLLNLLNNVKIPVVMLSNDMHIRRFTPSAQQLFNLIPSDLGRPISDIRVDITLPEFEALIAEVITTLDVQEREVQSSDGRWYQLRIRPYRTAENVIDGAVIALIDIDDIKQSQRQLEMSRLHAERIVETVREPLVVLGEKLKVMRANQAFYETFQTSAEDTEGRSLFDLGNGQWNIPELRTALTHVLNDSTQIQDFEIERDFKSIGRKTMLLNAREIEQIADGQMILLAIEDITERKQAEIERVKLAEAQAARREAEVANTSKDEFLSVLSHELRTPLNAILGWTRILTSSPSPDPTLLNRALTSIDRSARTQTRIIEDLLEVSRIIQGQLELRQAPVDLSELVNSVVESMLPAAEKANVQLAATIDDSPGYFYFDPDRLRQVFSNGLSNALKFTPVGGQVSTQLTYLSHQAQIQMIDTGEGIAPEFLPRVFDRFRQANSSNTRQYGGLGLGLSIVKTFVEAHEGTVHISSPGLGRGATLTITLPLIEAIKPVETATQLPDGDDLLTGLRILIVEDNIDNLEILMMMLEVQGAIVIPAISVAEAMDKLVEEDIIDLLLSDISLPGEDGFDLIRQIRASDEHSDLPAIAITGYAAISDTESIFHAGFQHHLTKPVELDELMAAIVDLVA